MTSSKFLPPKLRSNPVERIFNPFFVNCATHTCIELCPTSTKHTLTGSSVNSDVLKMPYANAVAVV